jgi:transcriptional regulator with XRE-family HTH domain
MGRRASQRTPGLSARLRLANRSYGSRIALASAIDRSEGALRKWLRGDAEPNATDLRLLCEATGASVEWLIFGDQERIRPDEVVSILAQFTYRIQCEMSRRNPIPWDALTTAKKQSLEERARIAFDAWRTEEGQRFHVRLRSS